MNKKEDLIKQAGLIFILLPIMIVILSLVTGTYLPVLGWMSTFTILVGIWLYSFASSDFSYVLSRVKKLKSAGSAEIVKVESLTTVYLGVQIGRSKKIVVNLEELIKATSYFGRWTIYYDLTTNTQIWHDHAIFGNDWFYIQY